MLVDEASNALESRASGGLVWILFAVDCVVALVSVGRFGYPGDWLVGWLVGWMALTYSLCNTGEH